MEKTPHRFAEWLSERLPVFWVPDAVAERRIRRWNQRLDQRTWRRVLAGAIVFSLVYYTVLWLGEAWFEHAHPGHWSGVSHRILILNAGVTTIVQVGIVLLWSNMLLMTGTFTLENLAMLEYGLPYGELTPAQRREMIVSRRAKMLANCFPADERQSAAQQSAERTAYRMLRRAGMAATIVAWAAYLIFPQRASEWLRQWGGLLMNSPLIFTSLVMGVIALPLVIRLWMEPDEMGEVQVVAMEKREA